MARISCSMPSMRPARLTQTSWLRCAEAPMRPRRHRRPRPDAHALHRQHAVARLGDDAVLGLVDLAQLGGQDLQRLRLLRVTLIGVVDRAPDLGGLAAQGLLVEFDHQRAGIDAHRLVVGGPGATAAAARR